VRRKFFNILENIERHSGVTSVRYHSHRPTNTLDMFLKHKLELRLGYLVIDSNNSIRDVDYRALDESFNNS